MNSITRMSDVLGVEQTLPELPASTYEMITRAAANHPDAPALSFFLRAQDHRHVHTWNYAQFFRKITASANMFHSMGIGCEDVIAIVLPNLPETHLAIWGGEATGIVHAINPLLESTALAELLKASGAKALVTLAPGAGAEIWDKLEPVVSALSSLQHLIFVDMKRYVSGNVSSSEGSQFDRTHIADRIAVHDFSSEIAVQANDRLLSARIFSPKDLSSFFCTGGTTGAPKIAMRNHGNEVANAWSTAQILGDSIGPGKTLFCGLPMFHVNAVLVTGLLPFSRGAHVLLGTPQGWRGEGVLSHFWEMVEHHKINFFSGVPTVYATLLQQSMEGHDVSSLEFGLCGAAPMPAELMRSFQEQTGLKILEGYGLTEGTCVSTVNPPHGKQRPGSIGLRLPLQAMQCVVLNGDGEFIRVCEPDEVGVLVISGPNVFVGYRLDEHNKGLWIATGDQRRWLNTGDLGRQDADGYFYMTGRKKDLIIRGGHNIDPALIEDALHKHPGVHLAAAVGRPDAHAGEVPVAYVQLKSGTEATGESLMAYARATIGERAAVPKSIRIVSSMPLTAVGKIYKPTLKMREIKDAIAEDLRQHQFERVNLEVMQIPQRGTCIQLTLNAGDDHQKAAQILGQYAFPFTLQQS